ncbi:MAG TPA: LLM class flavin-dependent oxidoreductase [Acidimicrobiales bacterium]|nr:LLM class flavin-dependent oxidoreductase [Acidimicrobiales bacterium]
MRLGVSLAQVGRLADPASVRSAAVAADQVGYSSLWVLDPAGLSPACGPALDPLTVLTYAAAVTSRVRLGTSVLVAPWYRPALLARSLSSLDVLSDGRLTVGLGLGWSLDGYGAAGVPQRELGRRLDEALDVLGAAWAGGDVGPRPAQRPRPPVLLAGYTPDALDRVARRADGWNPGGVPVAELGPMWTTVRALAAGHGRDPDDLALVVRAGVHLTDRPIEGGDRPSYHGSVEQVADDLVATGSAGADEVILGLDGDHGLNEALEHYACIAEAVDFVDESGWESTNFVHGTA